MKIQYRDGLSDGRRVVKANAIVIGFYMRPYQPLTDGYFFFYDSGTKMARFNTQHEMECFINNEPLFESLKHRHYKAA